MLSSQDEACNKLEFRSEMISYHSVHNHSYLCNNFARKRAGKIPPLLGRHLSTLHKNVVFLPSENKFCTCECGLLLTYKLNVSPVTVEVLFLIS